MTNAQEKGQHGHVFRPGPFRARRAYWLDGDVLHWRIGKRKGHVAVGQIVSMRLWMPQGDTVAHCDLVEESGRTHRIADRHWFGCSAAERPRLGQHQRRTATFRGLVFTLSRRIKKANGAVRFLYGPSRAEWIASWMVAGLVAMIVIGGAGVMISAGRVSWLALAFMGMALASSPPLWPVLRSGGPKPFDLERLHNAAPAPDWVDW